MSSGPDLSVILVTWNVRELVLTCIQCVFQRQGELEVEVILVDNGSSDGTLEAVQEGFPLVRIVQNHENLGFPRANNLALLEARGRHVLFLNPDTEVGDDTLVACVRELDADASLGAVGCRVLLPDGRVQVESARRHYRLLDLVWEAFYLHVLFPHSRVFAHQVMGDWDHEGDRDVEALVGAFIMVRRAVVLDVGGMPDEVFMYHEDLALCLRLEKRGWKIRYLGGVTTLHHHRASTARSSSPLELLEGEVRVRLIRERSGLLAGLAARFLFGFRAASRLFFALATRPFAGLRRRFPQVTDVRKQAGLVVWTVWPPFVRGRLRASGIPEDLRPGLLVVAPTPPPVHGVSVFTTMLLSSMELRTRFRVRHVDLADRRSSHNMGRLDVRNVVLAFVHVAEVLVAAWTQRPALCYLSLSQNALAFQRDALLIAAARSSGARVVTHLHGGYFGEFYRTAAGPLRWMIRHTLGWLHRCWVLGEGLRPLFDGLLPAKRVRVVPNGVPDIEHERHRVERSFDMPPTVLFMGQVSESKGVGDLLEALSLTEKEGRSAHCLIAGPYLTEGDRSVLEPRIRAMGEGGRVVALGVVQGEDKARALAEADIFVLPSKYPLEGQPLAILEAMAEGLPVVATPRAAIPDMVVDGVTGFLVPEGDIKALASNLSRLIEDADLRERMGRAGRELYLSRFTRERCLARVIQEFDDALA